MSTANLSVIADALRPILPDAIIEGRLISFRPREHFLRGLYVECSRTAGAFYVWAFALPLYVPQQTLSFNFGFRLRRNGIEMWDTAELPVTLAAAVKESAAPFLLSVQDMPGLVRMLKKSAANDDLYSLEALAYACSMLNERQCALALIAQLQARLDSSIIWQAEMLRRSMLIQSHLLSAPDAAIRQFESWEKESRKNLGIT